MIHPIGSYQRIVSKLKCLGPSPIYDNRSTVKFVDKTYKDHTKTSVSYKDTRKRIIAIPTTVYIVV